MRVTAQDSPFEFFFAFLMAISPIIGSVWTTPDVTKWIVFGVGCAMTLGVILAALRPVRRPS
jgi:hypothetical protein